MPAQPPGRLSHGAPGCQFFYLLILIVRVEHLKIFLGLGRAAAQ
jgi:hypothetical protein